MKNHNSTLFAAYARAQRTRTVMTTVLAGTFVLAQVVPSFATIDNTANAVGTYNGITTNYGTVTKNVPVTTSPAMTIVKTAASPSTAGGADPVHTDAGDTISYKYVVTNTGNTNMTGVAPTDPGPTFGGSAGTGTLSAFSPATANIPIGPGPTSSQTFTATYTLTALDVLHGAGVPNGVANTAGASGTVGSSGVVYNIPNPGKSTATTTITAFPQLNITKNFAIAKAPGNVGAGAELGDTITYTYVSCNTGNVAMSNVQILDKHVGTPVAVGAGGITNEALTTTATLGAAASSDAATNGIYDLLGAGGCVTFTWPHIVTQTEVDKG